MIQETLWLALWIEDRALIKEDEKSLYFHVCLKGTKSSVYLEDIENIGIKGTSNNTQSSYVL